jgi:hypothetical protein
MSPGALFGQSMLMCWKPCRARVERVVDERSLSRRDVAPCSFRVNGAQRSPPASPPRRISGLRRPALLLLARARPCGPGFLSLHQGGLLPRHQGGLGCATALLFPQLALADRISCLATRADSCHATKADCSGLPRRAQPPGLASKADFRFTAHSAAPRPRPSRRISGYAQRQPLTRPRPKADYGYPAPNYGTPSEILRPNYGYPARSGTPLFGSPRATTQNETCSSRVTYRTSLLGSPRANALNKTCYLRVTYRTSLFGSPRANALNETCYSRVTYRTSLFGSPRANALNEPCFEESRT